MVWLESSRGTMKWTLNDLARVLLMALNPGRVHGHSTMIWPFCWTTYHQGQSKPLQKHCRLCMQNCHGTCSVKYCFPQIIVWNLMTDLKRCFDDSILQNTHTIFSEECSSYAKESTSHVQHQWNSAVPHMYNLHILLLTAWACKTSIIIQ